MYFFGIFISITIVLQQSLACNFLYPTYGVTEYFDSHPEYPHEEYDISNEFECWYIVPSSNYSIKVWFDDDFDLEYHASCSYDYVRIDCDGGGLFTDIGRYCGSSNPIPQADAVYGAPDITLYVVFNPDSNVHGRGFRLYYTEVVGTWSHDCGWNSTDSSYSSGSSNNRGGNGGGGGVNAGGIVAIVFVVILILAVCGCVGLCYAKCCKKTNETRVGVLEYREYTMRY